MDNFGKFNFHVWDNSTGQAMKYFTYDLISNLRSGKLTKDKYIEYENLFEKANDDYLHYLQDIVDEMSPKVREFCEEYDLSDAEINGYEMNNGAYSISLTVHRAIPNMINLKFLADEVKFITNKEKKESYLEWMYEEIEKLRNGTWQARILLSSLEEIHINFTDLEIHHLYE